MLPPPLPPHHLPRTDLQLSLHLLHMHPTFPLLVLFMVVVPLVVAGKDNNPMRLVAITSPSRTLASSRPLTYSHPSWCINHSSLRWDNWEFPSTIPRSALHQDKLDQRQTLLLDNNASKTHRLRMRPSRHRRQTQHSTPNPALAPRLRLSPSHNLSPLVSLLTNNSHPNNISNLICHTRSSPNNTSTCNSTWHILNRVPSNIRS